VLCIPSANCAKKLPAIVEHDIVVDHKGNGNVVGRLNFPVVTNSVAAKVKKVEIELVASL